jgi:hypothetical protein
VSEPIVNSSPVILTGPLADRPAASKLKIGTLYNGPDTGLCAVQLVNGVKTWIVVSGGFLTVYTAPNATGRGLSSSDPMSLEDALAMAATGLSLTIQMATGDYGAPPDLAMSFPVGSIVTINGTYVDSGLGTRTTTGWTASTCSLAVSGAALTVNAHMGARLRFTSGAMSGKYYTIRSNTANAIVLFGERPDWSVHSGDTFVVERAGNQITLDNFYTLDGTGSVLVVRGLKIGGSASFNTLKIYGANYDFQGIEVYCSLSGYVVLDIDGGGGVLGISNTQNTFVENLSEHGCYFHGASINANGWLTAERTNLSFVGLTGNCYVLSVFQSNVVSYDYNLLSGQMLFEQSNYLQTFSVLDVNSFSYPILSGSGVGVYGVSLVRGSRGVFDLGSISGCSGQGMRMQQSSVVITGDVSDPSAGLTGSGNGTYGCTLTVQSSLMQIGTSGLTGASGNVHIGGNAGATTWAQIASAARTDLAAATPQLCSAQPDT